MEVADEKIADIKVLCGASCGATWEAARRVVGLPPREAAVRIGLEVQYFCAADPSDWDPISGKSKVHLAGEFHKSALKKALKNM